MLEDVYLGLDGCIGDLKHKLSFGYGSNPAEEINKTIRLDFGLIWLWVKFGTTPS